MGLSASYLLYHPLPGLSQQIRSSIPSRCEGTLWDTLPSSPWPDNPKWIRPLDLWALENLHHQASPATCYSSDRDSLVLPFLVFHPCPKQSANWRNKIRIPATGAIAHWDAIVCMQKLPVSIPAIFRYGWEALPSLRKWNHILLLPDTLTQYWVRWTNDLT